MIRILDGVADAEMMLAGVHRVHHHVVGLLKWAALQKSESTVEPIERGQIHAGEIVEQVRSEDQRAAGGCDVRLLIDDDGNDLLQHLATRNNDGTTRRPDQNIRAYAARSARRFV